MCIIDVLIAGINEEKNKDKNKKEKEEKRE